MLILSASSGGGLPGNFTQFYLILFVSIGLSKAFSVMRREEANTICVLSLIMLLLGLLLSSCIGALREPFHIPHAVALGIGVGALLCTIAAFVLSIVGLVDWKKRKGEFEYGLKHALSAMVFSVIFFTVFSAGLIKGFTSALRSAEGPQIVEQKGFDADEPQTNEEFNFSIKVPDRHWSMVDAELLNPDATFAFVRKNSGIFSVVIAEKLGAGVGTTSEELADISKMNMQSTVKDAEFEAYENYSTNGLEGVRFSSKMESEGQRFAFVHWTLGRNGYLYQVVTWGPVKETALIEEQSNEFMDSFSLLDPTLVFRGEADELLEDYVSESLGIRTHLADLPWMRAAEEDEAFPDAVLSGWQGDGIGFSVFPLHLAGTHLGETQLLNALLERAFPATDPLIAKREPVEMGGLTGEALTIKDEADGTEYVNHLRVLRRGEFVYLLNVYYPEPSTVGAGIASEFFTRIEFFEPVGEVDREAFDDRLNLLHGNFFNDVGLEFYGAKSYTEAGNYFWLAFEHGFDNPRYLDNFVEAAARSNQRKVAFEKLETHADRFPEHLDLTANHAWLLSLYDRGEEAMEKYQPLFENGLRDEDHLYIYVDLLEEAGRVGDAVAFVATYRAGGDQPDFIGLQSRLLSADGKIDEAIALLEAQPRPYEYRIAESLAYRYWEAEKHDTAISIVDDLIGQGYLSAETFGLKGRIEFDRDQFEQAKTAFEIALGYSPQNERLQEYLAASSSHLGQGSNSSLKRELPPVSLPSKLATHPNVWTGEKAPKGVSAYYLHRATAIHFVTDKEYRVTNHSSIKVIDAAGVERFSTIVYEFNPLSEEIYVNRLEVYNEEGKLVSKGKVDDYYVTDAADDGQADEEKALNIPVSGLRPGSRVELQVTRRYRSAPERLPFRNYYFSGRDPILNAVLYVEGDTKHVGWSNSDRFLPNVGKGYMAWQVKRPMTYTAEPFQQHPEEYLAEISIGDKREQWADNVQVYLARIQDRFRAEKRVKQTGSQVGKGLTSLSTKMLAAASFVQREITYKAIEFGVRGRMMNLASQTLDNRYGDCKDHSMLLWQMLKSQGVKAHLALVRTDGEVVESLPSLDQFDHMIVYVPGPNGSGQAFDATQKGYDMALPVPLGLNGKKILLLDSKQPRFVKLPEYPDKANQVSSYRAVSFKQGDMHVDETLTIHGYYAGYMRGHIGSEAPENYQRLLQSDLENVLPSLRIEKLDILGLAEVESPLKIKISYVIPKALRSQESTASALLPAVWEHYYISTNYTDRRVTPFSFSHPLTIESKITVTPPTGFALGVPSGQALRKAFDVLKWSLGWGQQMDLTEIEFSFYRPSGDYPANRFAKYNEAVEEVRSAINAELVFERASKASRGKIVGQR